MKKLFEEYIKLKKNINTKGTHNRWDFNKYLKEKVNPYNYLDLPYEVSWQITRSCNLNCNYCYATEFKYSKNLSTEQCYKIIDNLAGIKAYDVTLEGGEPFTRNDILNIIEKIKNNNLFVDVLTNGLLINQNIIHSLSNTLDHRVDGLQISIDDYNGKGIDPELQKIIYSLLENNINVRVNLVLTDTNIKILNTIYAQLINLGVKNGFNISQIIPMGNAKKINKPKLDELLKAYINLKNIESKQLPIFGGPAMIETHPLYNEVISEIFNAPSIKKNYNCSGGRVKVNIASDGSVYPCALLQHDELLLGNVTLNTLEEIWNSDKTNEFRNNLKHERCSGCINKIFCNSGCLGVAYEKNRNFISNDSRCLLKNI